MTSRRRISRHITSRLAVVAGLVTALALGPAVGSAGADPLPVIGAGSTFAAIPLDQWRADVNRRQGLSINYNATGSVNGQLGFTRGDFDFASSDISMLPSNQPQFGYTYAPIIAGGTAMAYNLTDAAGRRIDNLKLSPATIGKIFTDPGKMFWDDEAIKADNPDLAARLPRKELRRVARSEGSGTTAVFTNFIYNAARPAWDALTQLQQAFITDSPGGKFITEYDASFRAAITAQNGSWEFVRGSELMATTIATTGGQLQFNGYIGYLETGYALQKNLPIAYVKNASGAWVLPTARNVAVALLEATRNPDGTQNLLNVALGPRPEAYPISSYNYLLVRTRSPEDDATIIGKGETIARYLLYSITEGQRQAKELGYSPLPPNLVQQGLDVLREIPGAPEPPELGDWGKFYLDLETQAVVRPSEPSGGAAGGGSSGAGGGANAGAAGAGASRNGTNAARPGSTAGGAAVRGSSQTRGSSASAGQSASSGSPGSSAEDPLADPGVGGETGADEVSSDLASDDTSGGTEQASGAIDLVPSDTAAVNVATTTPLGKLPLGLIMLGFIAIPAAILGWRDRRTERQGAESDHSMV